MAEYLERLRPDYDIETAVSEGSFEKLQAYIDNRICRFQELALEKDAATLKKELTYEYRLCDWLIQKYTREKNIDYFFGHFTGLLASFKTQLTEEFRNQHANLIGKIDVPHLDDILFTIEAQEGIRHGKLAEAIGIEKSTLTGIMERIVASGAVVFSRPGKYKFYFLTDSGKKYCDQNRKQYNPRRTIDVLVAELIELINHESTPSDTVGKIVQAIYDQKSASDSLCTDNSKSRAEKMVEILSEEKPRFRLVDDPSGNSYQLESVFALHDIQWKNYELIIGANVPSRKTYALLSNRQEAI